MSDAGDGVQERESQVNFRNHAQPGNIPRSPRPRWSAARAAILYYGFRSKLPANEPAAISLSACRQ